MIRIIVFFFCAFLGVLSAQKITPTVIASAGAVMKGTNFSLEWTLGEVITESKTSPSLNVTQGFHQTGLGVTNVNDHNQLTGLDVFPNPVSSILNISNKSHSELQFTLRSLDGKEILKDHLNIGLNELNLQFLSSGHYILCIKNSSSQQNFSIEKIN